MHTFAVTPAGLVASAVVQGALGFSIDTVTQRLEIWSARRKCRRHLLAVENMRLTAKKLQHQRQQIPSAADGNDAKNEAATTTELGEEAGEEATLLVEGGVMPAAPNPPRPHDLHRSLRFAAVGVCFIGPWQLIRFTLIDNLVPGNAPWPDAFVKTALNVGLFGPFTLALGMGLNEYFKPGHDVEHVLKRLRKEWWKVQVATWTSRPLTNYFAWLFPSPWEQQLYAWTVESLVTMYGCWRLNIGETEQQQQQHHTQSISNDQKDTTNDGNQSNKLDGDDDTAPPGLLPFEKARETSLAARLRRKVDCSE